MNLFNNIVGYSDLKEIITGAVESDAKVHWLFHGPPASAKSMFLLEMEDKLDDTALVVGSRLSKSGLHDLIFEESPKYLLFDELDKIGKTCSSALLSLMEMGRLIITLKTQRVDQQFDVIIFATANRLNKVPPELLSRFQLLEFPEYTEEEFMNICRGYISNHENIKPKLAEYIGERVWNFMAIRDVRQVIRIARLARTKKKVDLIIKVLKKYNTRDIRYGHTAKHDYLENILRWGDGDIIQRRN